MRRSCVDQQSSIIQFQVRNPLKTLIQFMPLIGKKIRRASAVVLLVAGVPLWLVTFEIAPQIVQAYTVRADLSIDRLPEENYETLLRRAEAAARAAAQRSFDRDILVTDVSIIVSAQNYGAIAPILALEVSRPQWRTRPDPQRWANYFKSARSLLFFGQNFTTPTNSQPATTNTPVTRPSRPIPRPNTNPFQRPTPTPNFPGRPINVPQVVPPPASGVQPSR